LQRLLWILLDNAAKYTPAPGTIQVALVVFGRFYRADPSRSRVESTGLGLAITMWIAKVHHATLSARSQEGAGSLFRIVFPPARRTGGIETRGSRRESQPARYLIEVRWALAHADLQVQKGSHRKVTATGSTRKPERNVADQLP
jgi:hypothetical protein